MLREFKPTQKIAARVLVVGGIHGDELTAVSVVLRWLHDEITPFKLGSTGAERGEKAAPNPALPGATERLSQQRLPLTSPPSRSCATHRLR